MVATVEVTLSRCGYCYQLAWFADRSSFFRMIRFPALIAIIRHPVLGLILFDTGYGRALEQPQTTSAWLYNRLLPFKLPEEEHMSARLEQLKCTAVDLIFLSHFHPDHIGGLLEVPGSAPILHSREGLARLRSLNGLKKHRSAFFEQLLPHDFATRSRPIEALPVVAIDAPFYKGFDLAGDGSLIAVELPGHAAGQYGLLCRLTHGRRILLCADAAWLRSSITAKTRPTWAAKIIADDSRALNATQSLLYQFSMNHPDVQIIPSHCEASIIAYGQQA